MPYISLLCLTWFIVNFMIDISVLYAIIITFHTRKEGIKSEECPHEIITLYTEVTSNITTHEKYNVFYLAMIDLKTSSTGCPVCEFPLPPQTRPEGVQNSLTAHLKLISIQIDRTWTRVRMDKISRVKWRIKKWDHILPIGDCSDVRYRVYRYLVSIPVSIPWYRYLKSMSRWGIEKYRFLNSVSKWGI